MRRRQLLTMTLKMTTFLVIINIKSILGQAPPTFFPERPPSEDDDTEVSDMDDGDTNATSSKQMKKKIQVCLVW